MQEVKDHRNRRKLSSSLIASVSGSKLIKEAFDILSNIMTTKTAPYDDEFHFLKWN